MSGSWSLSRWTASNSRARSAGSRATTTDSRPGGGKTRSPYAGSQRPSWSPISASGSPTTVAMSPATAVVSVVAAPAAYVATRCARPGTAVGLPSRPRWWRTTSSREVSVPPRIRRYASGWPPASCSILKTLACRGSSGEPPAGGRYAATAASTSPTPTPVSAAPKTTGCMRPAAVARARDASRSRSAGGDPSTYARTTSSSKTDSRSASSSAKSGPRRGATDADLEPTSAGSLSAIASPASASRSAANVPSTDAPLRSILLAKTRNGMPSRSMIRISARVWAWMPSTADTTRTAPSRTARARSTSATKSAWPGVSTRLTLRSPTVNATTAERMVMPRRRSMASASVTVSPWSTRPRWVLTPVS